jgi:hypothetical protein
MNHTPSHTFHTLQRSKHSKKYPHAHPKACVGYCFTIGPHTYFHTPIYDQNPSDNDRGFAVPELHRPSHTFQAKGGDKTALAGDGDNKSDPLAPTCQEEAEALKSAPPWVGIWTNKPTLRQRLMLWVDWLI